MTSSAPTDDYQGKDIRGLDFRRRNLTGVSFQGATAGLKPFVVLLLLLVSVIAAGVCGLIGGYASAVPSLLSELLNSTQTSLVFLLEAGFLVLFLVTLILRGPGMALGIQVIALAVITALIAFAGSGRDAAPAVVLLSIVNAIALGGMMMGSLAMVVFICLGGRRWLPLPAAVAVVASIPGITEGMKASPTEAISLRPGVTTLIIFLTTLLLTLPFAIAAQASKGNPSYQLIKKVAVSFCTVFGTRFTGANLERADFSAASLSYCDFREARLARTLWRGATGLGLCRLGSTYLANPVVRDLVVSRHGSGGRYDHLNLRDLHLDGASLDGSSFIGSDLSGCSLRNANLRNTKLAQARLYAADLTEADISKACIEDWAISTDTCFDRVVCEEIYMRLPTSDNPDPWRKPDNRNDVFQPGDFNDFIAPIIKTLGLYRTQNIDPREVAQALRTLDIYHYDTITPAAAVVALNQLSEQNPESSLEVVALQGKGAEKVHLQALVTGDTSSAALSRQYQDLYLRAAALPAERLEEMMAMLADNNGRIRHLESLLSTAKQTSTNYYINAGGDISGIVNFGSIQGDVSNQAQ